MVSGCGRRLVLALLQLGTVYRGYEGARATHGVGERDLLGVPCVPQTLRGLDFLASTLGGEGGLDSGHVCSVLVVVVVVERE